MDGSAESEAKIGRVREWLAGQDHTGVLLTSNANFSWITAGGRGHIPLSEERGVASVLVTQDRAVVITTNIEGGRLVDEELPECFQVAEYPWQAPEVAGRSPLEQVAADLTGSDDFVVDLPTAQAKVAGPQLSRLRTVLVEPEIDRYRELGRDAAFALESACRAVNPKESELDMAAHIAALSYERGMDPVVNLVAGDERIPRYRHPLPTALRFSHSLMAVLVARRGGLHACLTRIVCFGEPDADRKARQAACARIDARMIAASIPGRELSGVLVAGIEQYAAEGFADEWRRHHQGGTTGYAGREVFATPSSKDRLKANQAVAWNPSVTGAKSEDTVLVTETGSEVLTESGHWPLLDIEMDGDVFRRPALLVR
ncbi:MAG TPA: M24 family metallopeptidase [Actinomycetota bacterium]|nr:M24 family metallopeptidase [Actinomycetota bacterium]